MEFDAKNVLTTFTENKENWIGWKGFFSDLPIIIKKKSESDNEPGRLVSVCGSDLSPYPFCDEDGVAYAFFYPIEPPKEKAIRPYKDIGELANKAFGYDSSECLECELAAYVMDKAVRKKNSREYLRIGACDMKCNLLEIEDTWHSMELFCDKFVWADGSPCGVEE